MYEGRQWERAVSIRQNTCNRPFLGVQQKEERWVCQQQLFTDEQDSRVRVECANSGTETVFVEDENTVYEYDCGCLRKRGCCGGVS